ncbi:11102_t:CDS:2, partial [Gigaspora margarita]
EKRENKILNSEEDPLGLPNNRQDISEYNTKPSSSNFSNNRDSRTSKPKKQKLEHSKIDTYLAKPLSKIGRLKFNNHLLLMTIANKWAFQWVNKKQSREAYAYLNPNLHLPNCHTLAGKTLNTVSDDIALYPKKVFQMSRIHASLLYEEHITQIKKEIFLGQNAALPIYDDNQESILLNDEEDEITDLLDENIDKWNKMIEEEQAQEDKEVYNFDLDIDNIDHPTINNAAK